MNSELTFGKWGCEYEMVRGSRCCRIRGIFWVKRGLCGFLLSIALFVAWKGMRCQMLLKTLDLGS